MNIQISTSEKLRKLSEAGVTHSEVARISGVPQPTIWRIASGKHSQPLERTVIAIDRAYQELIKKIKEVA